MLKLIPASRPSWSASRRSARSRRLDYQQVLDPATDQALRDHAGLTDAVRAFGWFMPCEVRTYPVSQLEEAKAWIDEDASHSTGPGFSGCDGQRRLTPALMAAPERPVVERWDRDAVGRPDHRDPGGRARVRGREHDCDGLSLTVDRVIEPLRDMRTVGLLLAANFAVVPAVAIVVARLLDGPGGRDGRHHLRLLAGAPFLPKLAQMAKGDVALGVGAMVLLMVVTVFYAPLVLPLAVEGATVDAWQIASSLILFMLVPLVGVRRPGALPGARGRVGRSGRPGLHDGALHRHRSRPPGQLAGHHRSGRELDLHRRRGHRGGGPDSGYLAASSDRSARVT